jgi:hypothetical protein
MLIGTFWISFQAVTSSDNDEDTEEESEEVTMIFQFPETFICQIVFFSSQNRKFSNLTKTKIIIFSS